MPTENSTISSLSSKLSSKGCKNSERGSDNDSLSNTRTNIGNQTNTSSTTDFESTNFSLTDIASTILSSSSTFTESDVEKSRNITRDLLLKKQLLHDVQKLKIELSQKDLLIDTMKAENLNCIDDLEERLSDVNHEKQIIATKYETKIRMLQVENEKKMNMLKSELAESRKLEQEYEEKYFELSKKFSSSKEEIVHVLLEEEEYFELKGKEDENLSPQELFSVKLYEHMRPLNVQIESLQQRIDLLTSDLQDKQDELEIERKEHEEVRQLKSELDVRCQRFQVQIEDLRSQLSHNSYRHQNYDAVQGERDSLERQIVDYERTCTTYKIELENKASQMEQIKNHMSEQNQKVALLYQDKDYLSKQLNELTPRYKVLEEKYEHVHKQLDDIKLSREELYEKYLNSREHYKREYEERMKRELDSISARTNEELDKIKESTKEMYERENRNLREARNVAVLEHERLLRSEKDAQSKYNELVGEFRQLQISSDSKIAQCENELKVKSFELDRMQMMNEESLKNNKQMGLQNDTLAKKLEALSKEYYALKGESDRKHTEMEGRNQELHSKLTIYEKLERELDDVVMQAAELTQEADSERVLFAYGYGANVPSTAKRRMQQSVQLARRVLQLERANTSLRHDVERESTKNKQLAEELKSSTGLLNDAQQPYNYLIDSMRTRDEQNKILKNTIQALETDIKLLKKENEHLRKSSNQMTSDLERLLNQREEMNILKQVVLNLKSSQGNKSLDKISKTSSTVYGPHVAFRTTSTLDDSRDSGTRAPKPLVFTNSDPPLWYAKLKQQNQASKTLRKTN